MQASRGEKGVRAKRGGGAGNRGFGGTLRDYSPPLSVKDGCG